MDPLRIGNMIDLGQRYEVGIQLRHYAVFLNHSLPILRFKGEQLDRN